jgi:hypothetical protein
VADLIYSDARLAAVYDWCEADRRDLDAYVELAVELGAQRVVDLFETRRPEQRGWQKWNDPLPMSVDVLGTGQVERRLELMNVDLPLVSFRFTYSFQADAVTLVSVPQPPKLTRRSPRPRKWDRAPLPVEPVQGQAAARW